MATFVLRLSNHRGGSVEIGPFNGRALADKLARDYPELVATVHELGRVELTEVYAGVLMRQDADPLPVEGGN